jgi:flagellar basal-body rod protein FlgC
MDLKIATDVSASGLRAQSLRMRVIAENLANADSVARTAGGDPYRRRMVVFAPETGAGDTGTGVKVRAIEGDKSAFRRIYQPGHPAADTQGYVKQANVNGLVESADMRAAQRAYEANLNAIEAARGMTMRTIDLIK